VADRLRAGIIGTGFMGRVHAHAVRAAGGEVAAVASSSAESAEAGATALLAERPVQSAAELIAAPDVDVVHICTPNDSHHELAVAAIAAGKHVICEKPLATTLGKASHLAALAAGSRLVTAVPFVYRYYAMVREARARVASGEVGALHLLHGEYLQDWLATSSDVNWRVDPAVGGASRAFADIGVHWCDLMEFVTGHRIIRLIAITPTFHPERGAGEHRHDVHTEDAAVVTFETDRGATGSVVISQVSLGKKNRLRFSFDGSQASLEFDQESPDVLVVGGRTSTVVVPRDARSLSPEARRYVAVPAGHPQGYQDAFNAFVADVYDAVSGDEQDGLATFEDGRRAAAITAAVIDSAARKTWVEVPA
jgi:predicted dehydrogenase